MWRSSRRRWALLALGLVALAACGGVPRPFEDENKATSPSPLLVPKADAGMVVVPVRGAPNRASVELADLVADRLRALELPASTRAANPQSRILEGEATATPGHDSTRASAPACLPAAPAQTFAAPLKAGTIGQPVVRSSSSGSPPRAARSARTRARADSSS